MANVMPTVLIQKQKPQKSGLFNKLQVVRNKFFIGTSRNAVGSMGDG